MADLKISALTGASTPLAGTEVLPIVQSGSTVKVSVANLTAGRAVATAGGSFTDNIIQSTAGKGINFTANANAPGMTSELLNWYEEGTWTPTDTSGAGLTFANVSALYTRIGRQVFAHYYLTYPTTADASANAIGGLPFTAANVNAARGGSTLTYHEFNAVTSIYGPRNGTAFQLVNGVGNALTNATCSGKTIMGCIIYFT
jgi:hypothetical protein